MRQSMRIIILRLKGDKNQLWCYRVGDYRIIYSFNESELWVLVVHVAHRKEVYR